MIEFHFNQLLSKLGVNISRLRIKWVVIVCAQREALWLVVLLAYGIIIIVANGN